MSRAESIPCPHCDCGLIDYEYCYSRAATEPSIEPVSCPLCDGAGALEFDSLYSDFVESAAEDEKETATIEAWLENNLSQAQLMLLSDDEKSELAHGAEARLLEKAA